MTDAELLAQHHAGSAEAFATLVRRHVDWVHGVARRRVGGDAALADDVTQATFLALARQSRRLRPDTTLPAWLFRVACHASARAVRDRRRRERHERAAAMERPSGDDDRPTAEDWAALAPAIDALVERLRQADREAILLRFYRQQTHAEIGRALGIGEEAARKRVERALGRLREMAGRRGLAVPATTATLAALLATGLAPAPASAGVVAVTVAASTRPTLAGASAGTLTKGAIAMAATAKTMTTFAAAGALLLLVVGGGVAYVAWRAPAASPASAVTRPASAAPGTSDAVARSASNLQAIGQLVLRYASGHDGRNPPGLGATLDSVPGSGAAPAAATQRTAAARVVAARLFVSPDSTLDVPADVTPAWVDAHATVAFPAHDCDVETLASYVGRPIVALHTSLAEPFVANGVPVVNIGYVDGRVETVPVATARQQIADSAASLDAARQMAQVPPADRGVIRVQSNLRQIGQALWMTARRGNGGRYPAGLGVAFEQLAARLDPTAAALLFLTPADREWFAADVEPTAEWVEAHASFVYLAAGADPSRLKGDAMNTTILAHTRLDAPLPTSSGRDVVAALFGDGHSESFEAAEMPARIEASKRTLAAAR